jgi:hypothetical protein
MRRCRLHKIPVQFYTSEHSMPTPFCTSHFMLRFINPARCIDTGITTIPGNHTAKTFIQRYRLPDQKGINIKGTIRLMTKKDVPQVYKIFNQQQENYKFKYKMT